MPSGNVTAPGPEHGSVPVLSGRLGTTPRHVTCFGILVTGTPGPASREERRPFQDGASALRPEPRPEGQGPSARSTWVSEPLPGGRLLGKVEEGLRCVQLGNKAPESGGRERRRAQVVCAPRVSAGPMTDYTGHVENRNPITTDPRPTWAHPAPSGRTDAPSPCRKWGCLCAGLSERGGGAGAGSRGPGEPAAPLAQDTWPLCRSCVR